MIALLLVASAALRIGTSATEVLAADGAIPALLKPADGASPPDKDNQRAEATALLAALQAREAALVEREQKAQVRAKALEVARAEIERRLEALEKVENQLRATLSLASSAAEDDLARLTSVYESMKPKDAAALFETMEPEFAAGFLGRMRPDAAANVMAGLSPQAAYTISVILAGRNAQVPKS